MEAKGNACSIFEESLFIYSCHCAAYIESNAVDTIIKKITMFDYHVLGKMPVTLRHSDE